MRKAAVVSMRGGRGVPPGAVRIDRRTKWGNPFAMRGPGDRGRVIAAYRNWMLRRIAAGGVSREMLRDEIAGRPLACWCAPLPCHGDVLAELAAAAAGPDEGWRKLTEAVEESRKAAA